MSLQYTGNWSFSWLMKYEACPMHFRLAKLDKIAPPELPPDNPLERGNRIHKHLEQYVKGEVDTLEGIEAKRITPLAGIYTHARDLYACGMATAEQDWLFDADWDETCKPWERSELDGVDVGSGKPIWLWAKLDLNVTDESQSLVVPVDYKSGKSGYKTVEHIQQLQLYAAISALKFPWADYINPELHYVDEGWVRQSKYTREQALAFVGRFQRRADRIYADRLFKPNPNKQTCKYCPYSPRGNGACPVGV